MSNRNFYFAPLFFLFLLSSCDKEEKAALQSQVDSLRVELETSQKMAGTLLEVGVLMDSIDANRQLLRVNMNLEQGISYDDYTARMDDINDYVKNTEKKLSALEEELKKSKTSASSYAGTIKKLRKDLETKAQEIAGLQEQVDKYRNENQNLIQTVDLQESMLLDKEVQIIEKNQELALIEARIQELMIQSKMTEAEAYYARGEAIEEAANRTKLAPKKKKETYREALELYKKALSLGNDQAQAKIDAMEAKLK
jgi:chromosome segregation ATPase